MLIKEVSYESNGFTFIDHQNGTVSMPWKWGRYLHFEQSDIETVEKFHDALSDFLEELGKELPPFLFEDEDDESSGIEIKFDADKEWYFPFEVALVAMRRWLKVREIKWPKWYYSCIEDGEFIEWKKCVIEITSKEMFKWSWEILPPEIK